MKRSEFLKKLGLGIGVAVVAPQVVNAKEETIPVKEEETKFAVDVNTISYFHGLSPAEILHIYKQTGTLLYDSNYGNAPTVFTGEIKVIDVSKR